MKNFYVVVVSISDIDFKRRIL